MLELPQYLAMAIILYFHTHPRHPANIAALFVVFPVNPTGNLLRFWN
jgi:hypothetical protein